MDSCLFCTAPSTGDENGKEAPLLLKEEVFTNEGDYHALREPFSELEGGGAEIGGESSKVHNHLNASFIISKILKLPQHSVSQILAHHHHKNIADFHSPEENHVSLNVCASCGVLVGQFYQILEQVLELERKLEGIEVELKSKISTSSNQVLVQSSSVNQLIRSLVLNGCSQDSTQEATYLHFNHNHHQIHSHVGEEETMIERNNHEVDHFENDEKDETEETEFKLNLAYMEQNNETSPRNPVEAAEIQNLSKQVPVVAVGTIKRRRPGGASWRNYPCDHCPYRSNNKQQFDEHAKAHEEGSKASPCLTCGWFVFPENMVHHYNIRHRRNMEVKKEPKKKPKRITKYRQCPQCQALVCGKLGEYRDHETMHLVGSGFECNLCGWLCKSLPHHNSKWHSKLKKVQMPEHNQIIIMP